MNILFLLKTLDLGGVEIVTATLGNKFFYEGHSVFVFAFERNSGDVINRFDKNVSILIGEGYKKSKENVNLLRDLLQQKRIQFVINQWGLPLIPIKVLNSARKGLNVKVISVYHNDPLYNGRTQSVQTLIDKESDDIKKTFLKLQKFFYRCITGYAMRYIYKRSDLFVVLSSSFVSHFRQFTKLAQTDRLVVIPNPMTIDEEEFEYKQELKENEIIYVGRLDSIQKKVNRVIETWALLESVFPNWRLTIVGDGEEMSDLKSLVNKLNVKRVSFTGFQNPLVYYKRASVLVLTSDYEGFGLVIVEGMSYGVVPVVYGSYASVYDIIENGKSGLIVTKEKTGFSADSMADNLKSLIKDSIILNRMAIAAVERSSHFSLDVIYRKWESLLSSLSKNKITFEDLQ